MGYQSAYYLQPLRKRRSSTEGGLGGVMVEGQLNLPLRTVRIGTVQQEVGVCPFQMNISDYWKTDSAETSTYEIGYLKEDCPICLY